MKTRRIVLGVVIAAAVICFGALAWYMLPRTHFMNGVKSYEFKQIQVTNGTNGNCFTVEKAAEIFYIVNNLQSTETKVSGISLGRGGYIYRLEFQNENGITIKKLTLCAEGRIRQDPYFYAPKDDSEGLTCLDYMEQLEGKYVEGKSMEMDTTLEFWITENVDNIDFSQYEAIPGWFGAQEYYGKEYGPAVDKNGEFILDKDGNKTKPEIYVSYITANYPDYSDSTKHITTITIQDPKVQIYGYCVNDSLEEFDRIFESMGFEVTKTGNAEYVHTATRDGITVKCVRKSIDPHTGEEQWAGSLTIQAEISNRRNMSF